MADSRGLEKNEKFESGENKAKGNVIKKKSRGKRPMCDRCKRPKKVCLCQAIPDKPLEISTTVYILQHPEERHRTLTTVPLLSACLPDDKCIVYNNVRYSQEKYPALHELLKCRQTLVLYPDANATDLREIVKESKPGEKYNLVVPDGTWRQARQIFKKNDVLQQARKVQLNENTKSHYVIRTQPTKNSLSTLEAIAVALSILEGRDDITEVLRKPLQLLCNIQLQHGAVAHMSKEEKLEQEILLQEQNKTKEGEETADEQVSERRGQEEAKKEEQHEPMLGEETQEQDRVGNPEQTEPEDNFKQQKRDQTSEHETEQPPKRSKLDP